MKNKKITFIVIALIILCAAVLIIWHLSRPKEYKPEIIEPEVFEDEAFDTDMIIGLWQSGTVFYRFNADGSGVTWDTSDDVMESEGGKFTWEVRNKRFTHYHMMEISSAVIPKTYTIRKLDLMNLEYEDDYHNKTTFIKVE